MVNGFALILLVIFADFALILWFNSTSFMEPSFDDFQLMCLPRLSKAETCSPPPSTFWPVLSSSSHATWGYQRADGCTEALAAIWSCLTAFSRRILRDGAGFASGPSWAPQRTRRWQCSILGWYRSSLLLLWWWCAQALWTEEHAFGSILSIHRYAFPNNSKSWYSSHHLTWKILFN